MKLFKKKETIVPEPPSKEIQAQGTGKIVRAVLVGGPCEGEYSETPYQDVIIVPYGSRTYSNFGMTGVARETLGLTGDPCYAIYQLRNDGRYHHEGNLTADYLRRHRDYNKVAPIKDDERICDGVYRLHRITSGRDDSLK